jgi:predicted adenine nucleotide alpha hydrolase (AANH) superfamily ATPase
LYRDFREGWREGQDEARAAGLYMQKYCGCVYSEEESGLGREIAKSFKKQGISPTNANVRKIIEERKVDNIINPSSLI